MGNIRCYVVVLQLSFYLQFTVSQYACPYKDCACGGAEVLCSSMRLQEFPQRISINSDLKWAIAIDGNNISRIDAASLPPNVSNLYMNGNPITTIDDSAFDGSATSLTAIYFARVLFTRVPDAIGHLRALEDFSITGANISDWNDDVWVKVGQTLVTLELQNVGISVWPSFTRHCTKLNTLNIIGNSFTSIPDGAFDSVAQNLTSLSLNSNRLTMVPKALSNLNSLQTLYLQTNHITDLSWLPKNSHLVILALSYNYISNASHVSEVLRPYNSSLNSFDIDNNHLTSIPDISYLTNVRELEFTHNKISDYISGSVSSSVFTLGLSYNLFPFVPKMLLKLLALTEISLSNNAIRALRETDFHNETTTIDLSYNLITELTDTSFPEHFVLQDLELNNNPLTKLSSVSLKNLPSLRYLNLRDTKITRLPLGLVYLRALENLDVSNNPMLVCTCMESGLTAGVKRLNQENVYGDCGQISVYDFFTILSPSCPTSAETPLWLTSHIRQP